jgi:diguanylate cyclase (GGDEF)-like protein/putative nucleotidyltransferase with HDIG domain
MSLKRSGHASIPAGQPLPFEQPRGPSIQPQSNTVSTVDALAAVRRLSFAVLEATEAAVIYRALVAELFAVFGVDQVHVTRVSQDHSVGRANAYRIGRNGAPEVGPEYMHHFEEESATRLVMDSGEPFNEPDARHSTAMDPRLTERYNARSGLFVPVAFGGDVRAVVGLISETPQVFDDEEVQLVYILANQTSAALAALEMSTRLSERAEQQSALARAARTLNARLDVAAVLDTLCHEANLSLGGDVAAVYLGGAESGGVAVAADGLEDSWLGTVMQAGEGVAGQALVTGRPVTTNAYKEEVRIPVNAALGAVETAVAVPVRWDGALKGALSVGFHSMRRISEEDMGTLEAIADLAAVACSNAEAFEQAQVQARTDSLTGLLNHGALQVRLIEEIARARRTDGPLCCLLLDLDAFKPINDRHGHLVGDQVLRLVAASLPAEFRPYDGLGRFGGDEFVLIMPGTDAAEALEASARLQAAIATAVTGAADLGLELTTSVGLARWEEPLTAGELLDRADRALLVAKCRGKDSVVLATAESEEELARVQAPASGPTRLVNELWGVVSRCESPHDVLNVLPGFMRRALEVEEVAFFGPHEQLPGFVRATSARVHGDPGPPAFPKHGLFVSEDRVAALRSSAISRKSLHDLQLALGADPAAAAPEEPAGSYAALPMARDGQVHGLLLMRSSCARFPLPSLRLAELLAAQAVTAMLGQTGGASRSAVGALAAAIDARDNYTHSHSRQVVHLAVETARLLGLSVTEVDRVRDGALLHDVGKVAIPNEILFKPGPLTLQEWAVMREHPVIGERILRHTPELAAIAPMVRHEHERWDGGGYPDGLRAEAIPMGSRIIFACDAYNAMITARPYRAPMPTEDAVAELRRGAGTQFDPQVLDALLRVLAEHAAKPVLA